MRKGSARARLILFHGGLTCFLFLCMLEALYFPLIGHPKWWHFHLHARLGEFIGQPPLMLGEWLLMYIPWAFSSLFAWLLALLWAMLLPAPLLFVLLRRLERLAASILLVKPTHLSGAPMTSKWLFDQGPRVAAMTTRQVLEEGMPILRVVHYSDEADWAFTCGSTVDTADARLIAMEEALAIDPSLSEIADLPIGWGATRSSVEAGWDRYGLPEA